MKEKDTIDSISTLADWGVQVVIAHNDDGYVVDLGQWEWDTFLCTVSQTIHEDLAEAVRLAYNKYVSLGG